MFTQEEQYTELFEPIPEPHQVPQNDNSIISEDSSVEQSGETVEQHPVNFEEKRALYDSLYQNLAIKVEKVNLVNRKFKETNADLTTELARFKNQENTMTIPRLAPFPATTPYAEVFTLFVIVSNSDDEITTLLVRPIPTSSDHSPTLYGFPLDSGEHLLDEDLSETAEITPHSDYFSISYGE
nr:hypothetical protein [Tanacetum cinerariifolium]